MSKTSERGPETSNSQRQIFSLASQHFLFDVHIVANDKDNAYLLQEDHGEAVDLDGQDSGQHGQGDVCEDADQREVRDTDEETEDAAKHSARGCWSLPVYQLFCGILIKYNNDNYVFEIFPSKVNVKCKLIIKLKFQRGCNLL